MRILVIGGNGFIGAPLVRELGADGHHVAILHRGGSDSTIPAGLLHIQGDRNRLTESESNIRTFAPEVIVDVILSSGDQAQQLTAFARKLNARIVAVSSMDVYRAWGVLHGTEEGGLEPMPITEDSALRTGRSTYSSEVLENLKSIFGWLTSDYNKVAVEQVIMAGSSENTVVRLPMVYGPGDLVRRMHPVLKRIADRCPAILISDDVAAWRAPRGYVDNVAHAIVLACVSKEAHGRTYHLCDEPTLTELEWQKRIAGQTDWRGEFVVLPRLQMPEHLLTPGNTSQHVIADSSRIRAELGFTEPVPFDEAIRRTIAWERTNPPFKAVFHKFDYEAEERGLAEHRSRVYAH